MPPLPPADFAYERLASHISAMVAAGTLLPGDRIPSVRRMSRQRQVSVPTVLQAYQLLESRGVIAARPRSGYYVLPPEPRRAARVLPAAARLADPAAITTADLIMRVQEMVANDALLPLGTALPDPLLLPGAALARALARTARAQLGSRRTAVPPAGAAVLRRAIAQRALEAGDTIAADDVVITCGGAEAITLCLRAVATPGDTVAVESPAWFGTLQALATLGLRALEIPVDAETGLDVDVLGEALARGGVAALVVTPNVHNPLGSTMPDARKEALIALAERHALPVIEDETYAELHRAAFRPRSLRSFDRGGIVLTCGSFSKTLAPDYRVGWTVPGRHRERVLHLKLATTVGTSVPPQLAIADYLASGSYDRHLRRLRQTLSSSVDRAAFEIMQRFPEGTRVGRPGGGFLLWVQLPDDVDAVSLQRRAAVRGLSVAPGPAFSATGAFRNFVRVNAGYRWTDEMERAVDVLAELVRGEMR